LRVTHNINKFMSGKQQLISSIFYRLTKKKMLKNYFMMFIFGLVHTAHR